MRHWLRVTAASVIFGCGPHATDKPDDAAVRFASAVCESSASCGCATTFSDDDECNGIYVERFDDVLDRGTTVEDECFEPIFDALKNDPCGAALAEQETVCISLQGSKHVGESCDFHAELPFVRVNECEDGLTCNSGQCGEPGGLPQTLHEGDPCWQQDSSCGDLQLFCDSGGTCRSFSQLGEACESYGCERPDLYCAGAEIDKTGICATKVQLGGACDPLDEGACFRDENPTHCDPVSKTCVPGSMPLCDAINRPIGWR